MAWYYNRNNQQVGPVDDAAVKDLIAAGTITASTMVWQNGMPSWQPAGATPLAALLPPGGPPPVVPAGSMPGPLPMSGPAKPGKVQAIAIMTLVGGILAGVWAITDILLGLAFCFPMFIGAYEVVLAILAIMKGAKLLGERGHLERSQGHGYHADRQYHLV